MTTLLHYLTAFLIVFASYLRKPSRSAWQAADEALWTEALKNCGSLE